jgi:hypothetical protein
MWVCLGSLATGGLAILLALISLFLGLFISHRYIGIGPGGWDLFSAFDQYWKLSMFAIPLLIFGLGCSVGFWFFSKRLTREASGFRAGR